MIPSDYSERLRNLVFNKQNGLILDACDHRDEDGVVTHRSDLAFYFPASQAGSKGRIRRFYITLSGLFRGRENLNECLEVLANTARKFSVNNQKIDYLVTCGATGRYLTEYLLPRLYPDTPSHTKTLYLGPYPHADEREIGNLNGKRCLIVTDVIASGSWIREIAQTLSEAQAEVVGCVSVVDTTDAETSVDVPQSDPRIPIPLLTLTNLSLPDLSESDFEQANLIEVTPGIVLNRLIADLSNNMLLGPEVSRNQDGTLEFNDKILFRRASGGYQLHFVTLWPLFEKLLCFEDLIESSRRSCPEPERRERHVFFNDRHLHGYRSSSVGTPSASN